MRAVRTRTQEGGAGTQSLMWEHSLNKFESAHVCSGRRVLVVNTHSHALRYTALHYSCSVLCVLVCLCVFVCSLCSVCAAECGTECVRAARSLCPRQCVFFGQDAPFLSDLFHLAGGGTSGSRGFSSHHPCFTLSDCPVG